MEGHSLLLRPFLNMQKVAKKVMILSRVGKTHSNFYSSPHRVERSRLDLKARIPIWKKEIYAHGPNAVWKENIEWFQQPYPPHQEPNEVDLSVTNTTEQPTPVSSVFHARRITVRQTETTNEWRQRILMIKMARAVKYRFSTKAGWQRQPFLRWRLKVIFTIKLPCLSF